MELIAKNVAISCDWMPNEIVYRWKNRKDAEIVPSIISNWTHFGRLAGSHALHCTRIKDDKSTKLIIGWATTHPDKRDSQRNHFVPCSFHGNAISETRWMALAGRKNRRWLCCQFRLFCVWFSPSCRAWCDKLSKKVNENQISRTFRPKHTHTHTRMPQKKLAE